MAEEIGDWTIREDDEADDCTHSVKGWGLTWWCASLEDARAAAELLNRLAGIVQDVSTE